MELSEFLAWVVSGGGAGIIAFWLAEKWPWLQAQSSQVKRYISLAGAGMLASLAYIASVSLAFIPSPAGWQGWLEALFGVAWMATAASQALHGKLKLR